MNTDNEALIDYLLSNSWASMSVDERSQLLNLAFSADRVRKFRPVGALFHDDLRGKLQHHQRYLLAGALAKFLSNQLGGNGFFRAAFAGCTSVDLVLLPQVASCFAAFLDGFSAYCRSRLEALRALEVAA